MTGGASSPTCPNPFVATRYHSLVMDPATMPGVLEITATDDGRGGHGVPPPGACRGGRPVPPGVRAHDLADPSCSRTSFFAAA